MPYQINLDEAIDSILDAVVSTLEAETGEGNYLEGIESVVRGDRARPTPRMPSLWVFVETATPQPSPRTIAETWIMPIVITPVLKEEDPEEGYRLATKYAARARSVLLHDRSLGHRPFIHDTRSARFEPSSPWHRRDSLFSAVAVVEVVFVILEQFELGG